MAVITPRNSSQLLEKPQSEIGIKTARLWKEYGWDKDPRNLSSILTKHPDCAEFLYETGLVFMIRGYQHTLDESQQIHPSMVEIQKGIQVHEYDQHPMLLVEGEWVFWADLKERIQWDPTNKKIVSSHNPSEEWNYFAPNGLCQKSRYSDIYPTYQLSQNDMTALQNEAERFFQGNAPQEFQGNKERWHYLQVFTSNNMTPSKLSHTGVRLIDASGAVYSNGFETLDSEIPYKDQAFVGTYNVYITSMDYDEFKPFSERRVTTIPLTEEQFNSGLEKIKTYAAMPLRFNRSHQNCTTYVTNVMKAVGHPLNVRSTLPGLIGDLLPHIPRLSKLIKCIAGSIFSVIPINFSTIITNTLALLLGADKGSPVKPGVPLTGIDNAEDLQYFDRLITKPSDILRNESAAIYSVPRFVNWQLEQGSTAIHKHDGSPQLTIIP